MAFCKNCGANLPEGATFCSSCGTPIQDTAAQQPQPQQYQANVNNNQPLDAEAADVQSNKAMAVLAYFGILVLIPIFAAKDSKFARYHATQGTTLFLFEIAYAIVTEIIKGILWVALPWYMMGIYYTISTIFSVCSIFFLVLLILGVVNAVQGNCKELPLIGKINILGKFMK